MFDHRRTSTSLTTPAVRKPSRHSSFCLSNLLRIIVRLAAFVVSQAVPAQKLHATSRRDDPAVALHDLYEARGILAGHFPADARDASAIAAAHLRLPLHATFLQPRERPA